MHGCPLRVAALRDLNGDDRGTRVLACLRQCLDAVYCILVFWRALWMPRDRLCKQHMQDLYASIECVLLIVSNPYAEARSYCTSCRRCKQP